MVTTYTIVDMEPASGSSQFGLSGADVIVTGPLDADVGPVTFTVEVSATDDGVPSLTSVTNAVVTITITGTILLFFFFFC